MLILFSFFLALPRTALSPGRHRMSLFFPSPAANVVLSSLCGVFTWNCGRGSRLWPTKSARLGSLGHFVSSLAAPEPPALAPNDPRRALRVGHSLRTAASSARRPPQRDKNEICGGRGKNKRELLGSHIFWAPPLRTRPSAPKNHKKGEKRKKKKQRHRRTFQKVQRTNFWWRREEGGRGGGGVKSDGVDNQSTCRNAFDARAGCRVPIHDSEAMDTVKNVENDRRC